MLIALVAGSGIVSEVQAQEGQTAATFERPFARIYASAFGPATPESVRVADSGQVQDGHDGTLSRRNTNAIRLNTLGLILGHTAVLAWYGQTHWWQDGFTGHFRTKNEGWFGRDTYSGGADKLGHFFMTYAGTRLYSRAFEWAGNAPDRSLRLAAWLIFGSFTGVEVLDGFSRKWRFSREDAVMNVVGIGLGVLMETRPELDRLLDFRIHYLPSSGSEFNPFGDYSGQTYLLVAKAAGVPGWRDRPFLRYLEFAVGYGSRGYSGDDPQSRVRGERNIYAGISLNLSALLDDRVYHSREPRSLLQRGTRTALEFVQVPGTGVAIKRSLD